MKKHMFLLLAALLQAPLATPAFAADQGLNFVPVVVETFTSKYCPNCPAGETTLAKYADGRNDFIVVLEHVDYWDNPANKQIDPLGNPDFTQRQYDYSNRLGRRPGEVFTPAPILDGNNMATPPLWMGWDGVLEKSMQNNFKVALTLAKKPDGGLEVTAPKEQKLDGLSLTLLAIEKNPEKPSLWQARAMGIKNISGAVTSLTRAEVPAGGSHLMVLLQESGGGAVKGMGMVAR
ncbi:MAG TPA: DUF1223 domain-containing protein [Alphaproteobacteria bacterium]|nr:DUF1223 domain-containing protein [Alphaproteobacteria bacterium]